MICSLGKRLYNVTKPHFTPKHRFNSRCILMRRRSHMHVSVAFWPILIISIPLFIVKLVTQGYIWNVMGLMPKYSTLQKIGLIVIYAYIWRKEKSFHKSNAFFAKKQVKAWWNVRINLSLTTNENQSGIICYARLAITTFSSVT